MFQTTNQMKKVVPASNRICIGIQATDVGIPLDIRISRSELLEWVKNRGRCETSTNIEIGPQYGDTTKRRWVNH